ncbi:MAG: hypothetical protein OEX02_08000 [Cyclobacteriaceae bacterium]|nr:hypothetical protein [Cyclobacteriaceae bacterium]
MRFKFLLFVILFGCVSRENKTDKDLLKRDSIAFQQEDADLDAQPVGQEEDKILKGYVKVHFRPDINLEFVSVDSLDKIEFNQDTVIINNVKYHYVDDEGTGEYDIESYFYYPESGNFILICTALKNGKYEVHMNGITFTVDRNSQFITYMDTDTFILSADYITSTDKQPIRESPEENSRAIENHKEYVFHPLEIKGNWLKVEDDKDCYFTEPSETDIVGWIKCKDKEGNLILKLGFSC